ncbi:MAG TPA: hypothetical protein VFQ26_01745, partial [Nitrospiraceae bacterium]|nr:hypothetical protein [Nitrospiraceae bacterium]
MESLIDQRKRLGSLGTYCCGSRILTLFLFIPLAAVFTEALKNGVESYFASFTDPDALSAIRLTFLAASLAVPLNLVFGVAAA